MITREPSFYQSFRCIGGKCPLTCCRDWEIVLDDDAIADYAAAPEHLRQRIADNLVEDEDGDVCFRLRPDGLCALLDEDGLCPIQRTWGEEHLCDHCGAYPRFIEEYGHLTERCQAVSCPEAARLVLKHGIFPLNEADDGQRDVPFDGVDGSLLDFLLSARTRAFALLAESSPSIWQRLAALLRDAERAQDAIDWDECAEFQPGPPDFPPVSAPPQTLPALAARLMETLAELEPLRPEWPGLLRRRAQALAALSPREYAALSEAYASARPEWPLHLRRMAEYLIFRHYPKAVNDDGLYPRAAVTAALCVVSHHLLLLDLHESTPPSCQSEALLWARLSREVEHMEENFFALAEELSDLARWPLAEILNGRL